MTPTAGRASNTCQSDQNNRRAWVPKFGLLPSRGKRKMQGELTAVTLRRKGSQWYVSFDCERETQVPKKRSIKNRIGLDMGVAVHTACSDDSFVAGPNALRAAAVRLAKEQRKWCRRKKQSRRRKKQAIKLSDLHERTATIRRDHLHKLTTKLAKNHGLVAIEDLRVANMTKSAKATAAEPGRDVSAKPSLNRRILNRGWGELRRQLTHKAKWYGSHLLAVPPAHTSRRCSRCHHVANENRTSQSHFCCMSCGLHINAGRNAAKNILMAGLAIDSGWRGRGERTGRRLDCPAEGLCKPVFKTGILAI